MNACVSTAACAARVGATSTTASLSKFTERIANVKRDRAFAPCELDYPSVGSWPASIEMAVGGSSSWQAYGHKLRTPEAALSALREPSASLASR